MRTRVGYAGGTKANPTYYALGDHAETIEIDYDPTQISYEELLDVFWKSHNPTYPSWSRQYMSAIFYHNEEQQRLAQTTKARQEAQRGAKIHTEIAAYTQFYLAEDYHQKYVLQNQREFMREFKAMYPNMSDFINSTAAARVNGYLAGDGSAEMLREEVEQLGLSPELQQKLRQRF
ncbi:methionine sulfoxide reductase A [Candidatus Vecturithrix granuli]|uniref:peptide-methionine (S)-S-oxide reductase n=1 Tax=Vecturithrix granuli TaxID=1499967 RepID=A0A081C1X1_VECG1|nr:methionine sulfoxide reductase A [Candidatus Vecturithrix granuli]